MKKTLLLLLVLLLQNTADAQIARRQYFDGADTLAHSFIAIHLDTAAENIWQIGPPQKMLFDTANSLPNVLITDTINTYPNSNTSRFIIGFNTRAWSGALYAVAFRWVQQLDLDTNHDGGIIEYSLDTGATWVNVFNNPQVYNFYGFDSLVNKDTLQTGEYAFSGTDTTWRDIWLCFNHITLNLSDSFMLRFTLTSDTVDNAREGWMIDNMMAQPTYFHTVNDTDPKGAFMVYPTITSGIVKVDTDNGTDKIDVLQVVDMRGRTVRDYKNLPASSTIDIHELPPGAYFIKVGAKMNGEIHKVVLVQ